MKLKTIIKKKPITVTNNIFNFDISFADDEESYSFNVNIPDYYVKLKYGDRKLINLIEDDLKSDYNYDRDDTTIDATFYTTYLKTVTDMLKAQYSYKWTQVLRMMYIHFNPEDNVFEHTVTTYEKAQREKEDTIGKTKTTNTFGEFETTNEKGEQVIDTDYGEKVVDNDYGQQVLDLSYGEAKSNTVEKTNPFNDTDVLYDTNKSVLTEEQKTNTETKQNYTDTTTDHSYTDTVTNGQHTDTLTEKQHIDTVEDDEKVNTYIEKTYTDTDTVDRHGNIGVTTTVSMFNEFQEYLRTYSNVWDIILDDCLKTISRGY